jgi:hypothetical protein
MRVGPQRGVDYGAAALTKLAGVSAGLLSAPDTECPATMAKRQDRDRLALNIRCDAKKIAATSLA